VAKTDQWNDSWLGPSRKQVTSGLEAYVCSDCGFTELYAVKAEPFHEAIPEAEPAAEEDQQPSGARGQRRPKGS
jgi:hypothetical protein